MGRKILTPGNVQQIQEMYAVKNEWGEARYTGAEIAVMLGVSESTIWRVLKKQAAYRKLFTPPREETAQRLESAYKAVQSATPLSEGELQTSLQKLGKDIAAQKESTLKTLEELSSPEVRAQAHNFLGR